MALRIPEIDGPVITFMHRNRFQFGAKIGDAGPMAHIVVRQFLACITEGGIRRLTVSPQIGDGRFHAVDVKFLAQHGVTLRVYNQTAVGVVPGFFEHIPRSIKLSLKTGIALGSHKDRLIFFIIIGFEQEVARPVVPLFKRSIALCDDDRVSFLVQIGDTAVQPGQAVIGHSSRRVPASDQHRLPIRAEKRLVNHIVFFIVHPLDAGRSVDVYRLVSRVEPGRRDDVAVQVVIIIDGGIAVNLCQGGAV